MNYHELRHLFPVTNQHTFLNHAAIAPLSTKVTDIMAAHIGEVAAAASHGYPRWMEQVDTVRQSAATLIGVDAQDIAFVGNTSGGLATIAEAFPWQAGDAVMFTVPDYPANVYPWQHLRSRGVELRPVPRQNGRIEPEQLQAAWQPNVRMLAMSSVDYATGFAADLPAIGRWCAQQNTLFAVDAIQSLGVVPLDAQECGIHFLATGAQKWLLGPMGTGLLYLHPEQRQRLRPPLVGWKSVVEPENFDLNFELREDAARFEPGTLNLTGIFGLGAALELLLEIGIDNIRLRVLSLLERLAGRCTELGLTSPTPVEEENRAGIYSVEVPEPDRSFRTLTEAGIFHSLRDGRLRFSPHFYNSEEEIDRTIDLLAHNAVF